jgi:hypothetical protein
MTGGYSDAYCHVGPPRFGTLEQAIRMFDLSGIPRGVLVLGPGMPAYRTLFRAMAQYPDRLRGVGILCGATASRRKEIAEMQVRAGAIGLRMEPPEVEANPEVLDLLGAAGKWIFAVGAAQGGHTGTVHALLGWLARYPRGRVAAPHFLAPTPFDPATDDGRALAELIGHPRFFAIFSRHGGVGSRMPYPHADLAPWVHQVIDIAGAERILWGSEFPVACWRNETLPECQGWLAELDPGLGESLLKGFHDDNARRLFFSGPVSELEEQVPPAWVEEEFDTRRKVPLLPHGTLHLSVSAYERLFDGFFATLGSSPGAQGSAARFSRYLESVLEDRA